MYAIRLRHQTLPRPSGRPFARLETSTANTPHLGSPTVDHAESVQARHDIYENPTAETSVGRLIPAHEACPVFNTFCYTHTCRCKSRNHPPSLLIITPTPPFLTPPYLFPSCSPECFPQKRTMHATTLPQRGTRQHGLLLASSLSKRVVDPSIL